MGQSEVSYELAHKMFRYEPIEGVLIRKITVSSRALAGYRIRGTNVAGYVTVRFEARLQYAHRIIWLMHYKAWPTMDIDHVNGNPGVNRLENLRHVSRSDNLLNKYVASGVYWAKRDNVWVASMQVDGIKFHIGQHKLKIVAEAMYKQAKQAYAPRFQVNAST